MTATATKESAAQAELSRRAQSPAQRFQHLLHGHPAISPAILLVLTVIVFSIINPRFASANSLSILVQQTAIVAMLAIGQTLIILTAGIDLSVAAISTLSMMFMGSLGAQHGVPGWLALLLGLALGLVAGALNGFLVTRLNLPPFIVTLGTLSIFTAIALLYSGGASIEGSGMPSLLTFAGTGFSVGGFRVTTGMIIMLLAYLVIGFILSQTAWGRYVYAVGDDAESSRLSGIPSKRVLLSVYAVAGVIYGFAAWCVIGRIDQASPNALADYNLQSITAVVVGGTSLFGGRGGVLGTLLGALIVQSFNTGLSLAGVNQNWRILVTGVLVILAVSIDQWIRRVKS